MFKKNEYFVIIVDLLFENDLHRRMCGSASDRDVVLVIVSNDTKILSRADFSYLCRSN